MRLRLVIRRRGNPKTILLEAEMVGGSGTAQSIGLVREDFDASFRDAAQIHGLRASRAMWQTMRRAALDFAAAIRRLGIRCDLAPCDFLTIARAGSETSRAFYREYQSRRDAGLEQSWVKPPAVRRETAIENDGGIRTHGFSLDPYRAGVGFAAAAVARGALLYERSPVRRIRADARGCRSRRQPARLRRTRCSLRRPLRYPICVRSAVTSK